MRHLVIIAVTLTALVGSLYLSARDSVPSVAKVDKIDAKNPWTNLEFNNNPRNFQFAIVTDRTGGHRNKVFEKAVRKLNIMQPEFVISVGDLVEGYTDKGPEANAQWTEFNGFLKDLKVPFFYVTGNHDLKTPLLKDLWNAQFGRPYYHFVYQDCLFLAVSTDIAPEGKDVKIKNIGEEQIEYFKNVLAQNPNPRFTFVFMHKPLWTYGDGNGAGTGWPEMEQLLAPRRCMVFCGHVHHYQTWVRNGNRYVQLATTGGGSMMRGKAYGEFDQIGWITMKDDTPILANVLLDGIIDIDLQKDLQDDKEMVEAQEVQRREIEAARAKRAAEMKAKTPAKP